MRLARFFLAAALSVTAAASETKVLENFTLIDGTGRPPYMAPHMDAT